VVVDTFYVRIISHLLYDFVRRLVHLFWNYLYNIIIIVIFCAVSVSPVGLAIGLSLSPVVFVHFFGNAVPPMRPRPIGRVPARANAEKKHYCQKKPRAGGRPETGVVGAIASLFARHGRRKRRPYRKKLLFSTIIPIIFYVF